MIRTAAWILCLFFSASALMFGQDDFTAGAEIGKAGNDFVQAMSEGATQTEKSVVDTMSQAQENPTVQWGENKGLQVMVKALGGAGMGAVPVGPISQALGDYAGGGSPVAAGNKIVSNTMAAIVGWAVADIVGGLEVGGAIAVGGVSAPAWIPVAIAGAAAFWVTKQVYGQIVIEPGTADSTPVKTLHQFPNQDEPSQPVEGSTASLPTYRPPVTKKTTTSPPTSPTKPIPPPVKVPPEYIHHDHNNGGSHHSG